PCHDQWDVGFGAVPGIDCERRPRTRGEVTTGVRRRGRIAPTTDRVRGRRVIKSSPGRAVAGYNGSAGVMLRQTEGVGGWAVQERFHRPGAEFGCDRVQLDDGDHSPGAGALRGPRCSGLVW